MRIRILLAIAVCLLPLLGWGCSSYTSHQDSVKSAAAATLHALHTKDFATLVTLVHPDKGVRFSPYSHVNIQTDRVLRTDQLTTAWADTSTSTWGSFDGSGEPIALTFTDYYNRFIFEQDFTKAPEVNTANFHGTGNAIDNWKDVYPDGQMVEYYFPGFDPQYGGMDWRSLRLVFEQKNSIWYLVGIIHGEWTI